MARRERSPRRLVIDTNILVAALLHPGRTPDRALAKVIERGMTLLIDDRIEAEYRDVLWRPKFASIDPARRDGLLDALGCAAERVECVACDIAMIDPADRRFVEVARAGRADALLTGNVKHFPIELGVHVISPAALLADEWPR
ncbi:putative toxin-antitoxin system toxin component, PIN family [Sandaracinus amylolyticus]|uniref:PIN domain-containing protein n=1 Tax=Sandaracinus amylolyticus TaxID=927083 RepID=A0A0F6W0H4_9BACT|nr:putative toxin-antitoxin system toxin component, PIN family [Sandaracinus amylolyticus]AKF04292.1 hypothetical protein DB32_001441 [Sandaracinus amylolyticus]